VCTASYIVKPGVRGGGIGKRLGEHSIEEAKRLSYRAMQFNLVVSTNEPAMRLWKKLGFSIVGTLPKAFQHNDLGFVDAYVMYLELE
jgi:ribosomal protein S18 acetylase RimI-like enzyme